MKIVEPGGIKTDFGGRSLDFSDDPDLTEYQPLVKKVLDVLAPMTANGSEPEQIAEVIYCATIDGTDQLRYEAGADSVHMLAGRRAADDVTFLGGLKAQFELAGWQ